MAKVEGRNSDGRFAKGNTGGGRLGTATDKTAKKLLTANSEAITLKVIELALDGDTSMLKLCIDKLLPNTSLAQEFITEQVLALTEAQNDIE